MPRDDAAWVGFTWDAMLSGAARQPADAEFAETTAQLHAGDDAPHVDPAFAGRLGSQFSSERAHTLRERQMSQPARLFSNTSAGFPSRSRVVASPWRRPSRAFNTFATIVLILAIAIGAFLINRPMNDRGADAPLIAAPASPTFDQRARLIMFVRNCPAGYDIFSASENLFYDCPTVATGVPFTLSGNGIVPITRKVIGDGWVDYYPLEAGQYTLTEATPAGMTSAFIYGCSNMNGSFESFPFSPMARIGSDGKLVLNILAGDKFACGWYNVPAAPDVSTPTP